MGERTGYPVAAVLGWSCFATAFAGLMLTGNHSIRPSPDSEATLSLWQAVVPAAVCLALVRLVPPSSSLLRRSPEREPPEREPPEREPPNGLGLRRAAVVLGCTAVAFPLGWYAVLLAGADAALVGGLWAISKPVVFLLLPWLMLRGTVDRLLPSPPGESLWRPPGAWRWVGAAVAVACYAAVTMTGPLAASPPRAEDYPDPLVLAIGASLTFVTANVVEELFFRVALQTRLEALVGRWPGILAASLGFGLMHLPTHRQTGELLAGLPQTLAAVVVFQGTFGLAAGYLWSRYRNVWANVALHSVVNTLPLVFLL